VNERSTISHYFDLYPSAPQSFLEAVEHVSGRESWITPVATPTTRAVDDLLVVAGSREAADRTVSAVHDIGDRAYDESTPIPDTLEPGTLFGLGINTLPYAYRIPKNLRQHCTTLPCSTSDARLHSRLITDEYTETLPYGLVAELLEQTGENHTYLSSLLAAVGKGLRACTLSSEQQLTLPYAMLTTIAGATGDSDIQSCRFDLDSLSHAKRNLRHTMWQHMSSS
jgi:hypothetical protein